MNHKANMQYNWLKMMSGHKTVNNKWSVLVGLECLECRVEQSRHKVSFKY